MSYDAFVSYATPDRAITMALVDDLEARGLSCWIAPRDVPGGSKYAEVILNALSESKVFLLVFSETSNASDHVLREVERALHGSKKIVPVRIADVMPSGAMDYYLATLHWIDAFGAARDGSFDLTAEALASLLGKELKAPAPAPAAVVESTTAGRIKTPARKEAEAVISHGPPVKLSPGKGGAGDEKKAAGRTGAVVAAVALAIVGAGLIFWKAIDWQGGDRGPIQNRTVAVDPSAEPLDAVVVAPVPDRAAESVATENRGRPAARTEAVASLPQPNQPPAATASPPAVPVAKPVKIKVSPINFAGADTVLMPEPGQGTEPETEPDQEMETVVSADSLIEAIAQAESQWQAKQLEATAQTLVEIAARGGAVVTRIKTDGDGAGGRLKTLLDEVSAAAGEGHLGTLQVVAESWQPVLQLAAATGNLQALSSLAKLTWDAGDTIEAARNLEHYEKLTRGADALDPTVADLLGEVIREAEADPARIQGEHWEPALELAWTHEMRGALQVLADLIHGRNPAEAVPLYRQLYSQAQRAGTLRNRIGFCLQMLERYDLEDEVHFYRTQLDDAFELIVETMAQLSRSGELADAIPAIRDAAAAGIAPAQYIMGNLLSEGKGMEKDVWRAFDFFRKAAAAGYGRGKYAVGECYLEGRGVDVDRDETLRIWRGMSESEVAEVPQVLFNLASMSTSVTESEQFYSRARRHYEVKVSAGQVAEYGSGLGQMLISGWGGEADAKRGVELLEASVEKGSSHGAFVLGLLLVAEEIEPFTGMRAAAGIARDQAKGTGLLKTAAREGIPNALLWCEKNGVVIDD